MVGGWSRSHADWASTDPEPICQADLPSLGAHYLARDIGAPETRSVTTSSESKSWCNSVSRSG
jgi:hypothetical protein